MRFEFDWDPKKESANRRKHGVTFTRATEIFRDAYVISIPDVEHSDFEERWISLGIDYKGVILVVVHTFAHSNVKDGRIRIISSRKATAKELEQYEKGI